MSPHAALDGKVPNAIWYNKKPKVSSLRIFGCRASWPAVPQHEGSKLEAKGISLICWIRSQR